MNSDSLDSEYSSILFCADEEARVEVAVAAGILFLITVCIDCLQCFVSVGWASGRASSL